MIIFASQKYSKSNISFKCRPFLSSFYLRTSASTFWCGFLLANTFPDTHHVVGGHGHHVVVVVRRRHFIDDDIVAIEGNFSGIFQVIILQFGPKQTCAHFHSGFGLGRWRIFAELRYVVQPQ